MSRSEVAAPRWQDLDPTSTPGQVRVRVLTSKTNPAADREDYRLTVNGFGRALASKLVRRAVSTSAVQQPGGWRNPQMPSRYASAVVVEDDTVGRYFG